MKTFDELYREIEKKSLDCVDKSFEDDYRKQPNRRVVLYGAGGNCELAIFTCEMQKIPVTCLCDTHKTGTYDYKGTGYEIISPEKLLKQYKDALLLITTWNFEAEIYMYLLDLGIEEERIYFLRSPYRLTPKVFKDLYYDGYRWAYEFFDDEHSKTKIIERIGLYLTGKPVSGDCLYEDGYFEAPFIQLRDDEVYVDGGAFDGESAIDFVNRMKMADKKYSHIYSFDPDPENCKNTKENLADYENVSVLQYGLWSKETELTFSAEGSQSSCINESDEMTGIKVKVTSLDELFRDEPKEKWPTIVKMDVEGAEKEALWGAKKIIAEKKPGLIICAYHKPEDIYELVEAILQIREDYELSLWQMGTGIWDLVLYGR